MATYQKVYSKFWTDEKVCKWNDDAKMLAIYLLTCDHKTTEGLFRISIGYMIDDLNWEKDRILKSLNFLIEQSFLSYDFNVSVVFIHNCLKHNSFANDNQRKGAINKLEDLPKTYLLKEFIDAVKNEDEILWEQMVQRFGNTFETVSKPFRNPLETVSKPHTHTHTHSHTHSQDQNIVSTSVLTCQQPASQSDDASESTDEKIVAFKPKEDAPFQDILRLFAKHLGLSLPVPRKLNDSRKSILRARHDELKTLEAWEEFYREISASDFLMGRKSEWKACFDWIHKRSNFTKIREGNYRNRAAPKKRTSIDIYREIARELEEQEGGVMYDTG